MPSITRDGAMLHFDDRGVGAPIIVQHPLSADARSWSANGLIEALLAAGFRVIAPDALGHGKSGIAGADRVGLIQRVQDLIAVADALDLDRFHYAGYSMGGWIGTGLARYSPNRLLSLGIAGWDPIDGARRFTPITDMALRRAEFEKTIAALKEKSPGQSPPDAVRLHGYVDTYERLFKDVPSIVSLIGTDFPVMLAVGNADPYAPSVASAAEALAVELFSLPGDHVEAFLSSEYRIGLVNWLDRARTRAGEEAPGLPSTPC